MEKTREEIFTENKEAVLDELKKLSAQLHKYDKAVSYLLQGYQHYPEELDDLSNVIEDCIDDLYAAVDKYEMPEDEAPDND